MIVTHICFLFFTVLVFEQGDDLVHIFLLNSSYLAVVSSEVEVNSLRSGPVPSTVAGCERDPDNSSAVPGSEPALLVVAFPAHRLLLLALGHSALPGQAQDVGVAAKDRAMLHGGEHPCSSLHSPRGFLKKVTRREVRGGV